MSDTIHSCSPFCTLPACVKERQHRDFEAWCKTEGGIRTFRDSTPIANGGTDGYESAFTNHAWWGWQAAIERATAIERERCAVVCENRVRGDMSEYDDEARDCAEAIRQGGAG